METFYETVATFAFTLLGLWWAVVQFGFETWMADARARRTAHAIHLAFLIPGAMSLGALVSGDQPLIWRSVFSIASLFGLFAAASAMALRTDWRWRLGQIATCLLYGCTLATALLPPALLPALGLSLAPLQVEGLLLTAIVTLGVNFTWMVLVGLHSDPR